MADSEFLNIRVIGAQLRVKHYPAATYLEHVGCAARFIPHAVQAAAFDGSAWDLSALAALAQRQLGALIPFAEYPIEVVSMYTLRVRRWRDVSCWQVLTAPRNLFGRGMDMDEVAGLRVRIGASVYRVKVFARTVWVERQPGGDNLSFARAEHPVFDGEAWDLTALSTLIGSYHREVLDL